MTDSRFASLPLHPDLLGALTRLGYEQMTPIQAAALPPALLGRDLIARAQTGSGKTAAFALTLLTQLNPRHFGVQSLVLCPTRELADQVATEIRRLAAASDNIKVVTLCGGVPLRDVYGKLDGPILIMLACLIPVSESLQATGATTLIASLLSQIASGLPPYAALALIILAAMAVTPFLNNAATVLVMAPIAATFATDLGLRPEAFLMGVAIGAGCDFLTPIGHQCNTLVMGPGGYRFSDYPRLGLPLSFLIVLVSVPTLMWFWPLQ